MKGTDLLRTNLRVYEDWEKCRKDGVAQMQSKVLITLPVYVMPKEDLNRWVVWVEPFSNFCTVPIYMKMLGSDIAQAYKATNLCPLMTDEEALEKFMIVMWASFEKEDHGNL